MFTVTLSGDESMRTEQFQADRIITRMFILGGKMQYQENHIKVINNARLGRDGGDDSDKCSWAVSKMWLRIKEY